MSEREEMSDPSLTVATETITPGRYHLDPSRSRVLYSGKHMFGLGTVHATFTIRDGELRVDEELTASEVSVTVAAASFSSNSARRDKDVRSAGLLHADKYPDITFTSHGLRTAPDGWLMAGTVTAHGHSAPADVRIHRVSREGADIRIQGRVEHLDRTAFGITGSRGIVGRYLDLGLDVFATRA